MLPKKLIEKLLEQIQSDVHSEDLTAIEEFLRIALVYIPEKYLISYLSEEKQNA